jgi:hypothetical protein
MHLEEREGSVFPQKDKTRNGIGAIFVDPPRVVSNFTVS